MWASWLVWKQSARLVFALAVLASIAAAQDGLVVLEIARSSGGEIAGLKAGDVLASWSRGNDHGTLESPYDWNEIETAQAPLGPVEIAGSRGSQPMTWKLGEVAWQVLCRPVLTDTTLVDFVGDDSGRARATFFAAHPNSTYYADFRDFAFWRLRVDYVCYIGGYGRMSWISQADWRAAEPDPLGPSAAGIIAHMNADHADAMVLYCKAFSHGSEITSAKMTGVDRYGFDMSAITSNGPRPVRLAFGKPVSTPEEMRAALISMVKDASSKLAEGAL